MWNRNRTGLMGVIGDQWLKTQDTRKEEVEEAYGGDSWFYCLWCVSWLSG